MGGGTPDPFSGPGASHITPVGLAIYAGHESIVDELARIDPSILTSKDNLALAALRPSPAMARKCLVAGATPWIPYSFHGIVPLHTAIAGGDLDIVAEFLKLGSYARCVDGVTTTEVKKEGSDLLVLSDTSLAWPLEVAVETFPKPNVDLVRLLLKHGAFEGDFRYHVEEGFLEHRFDILVEGRIKADDIACVEVLLQHSKGEPTANFVGYARSPEMLQLLLRYATNFDMEDECGDRPLHIMARELVDGQNKNAPTAAALETFIMLIKESRRINAQNFNGFTALHICARGMRDSSYKFWCPTIEKRHAYEKRIGLYVKTLLDLGAKPRVSSLLGWTALHEATSGKHWKAAKLLVQAGPKAVNMRNRYGETPLHMLFGSYILPERGDRVGRRLRAACTGQTLDILKLLVGRGADPNLRDGRGFAPLFRALTERSLKAVRCLLCLGANPNVRDRSSDTVLIRAAQVSSVGIVRLLVATGADVDARGGYGGTALIAAAVRGRRDVLRALLGLGANAEMQDNTVMDHIERFGGFKNEVAHILVGRGLSLPDAFVLAPLAGEPGRKRKRKRTASMDIGDSQD